MRRRSLFWPFVLIATGLVWLLIQLRTIPVENLWALMYIWPFFLMAIGVGLILGSRWPLSRMIISGLTVLGMVLAIVFAPQLSWNRAPAWNFFNLTTGINGSVAGSGVVVSQARQVADFNSVEINFPVELTIRQGGSTAVTVEAENNLLPQLATRVSGSTLYIENSQRDWTKRVNPTRAVKVTVTVKDLQQVDFPSAGTLLVDTLQTDHLDVSISGAGTVKLLNLTAHNLTSNLSGAGNITASGTVDSLNSDISGFGSFNGNDLSCKNASITISGAGNATVWANSSLNVEISGTGSVRYYGSPSLQKNISGLGSVNSLGNK